MIRREFIRLAAALVLPILGGCERIVEVWTPAKTAASTRSTQAIAADEIFWTTFHEGRYEDIDAALDAQTAAYLSNPRDATTAAHVAWLHMWRLGERARLATPKPTITDDALLARRYFAEAYALVPAEARYRGFLAAATLADGAINQDPRVGVRGYFETTRAIDDWPEFNLFTAGYALSGQPADSERFAQALDWQWENLERCLDARIDRSHPDVRAYARLETRTGAKRACWNSAIAPHNVEGFFLNLGDMLVKSGDVAAARIAYGNATLSKTYGEWPFRAVLEARIGAAADNVTTFRRAGDAPVERRILLDSPYACMACHQQ